MKSIAFFNNKGGVGKTTLVYHLAWVYHDLGFRVLVADLDPQANLTASFLDEDRLEELWQREDGADSIYGCVKPLIDGTGDISAPHIEEIEDKLGLVVGDLLLSSFEDQLSSEWPRCSDGIARSFRVISAFWRIVDIAADKWNADVVLIDVGPNLGAINRAALIATDNVVVPLSPDLYSLQGLKNLGPTLRAWREQWAQRKLKRPESLGIRLPAGTMDPVGYVVLQHAVRLDRPVQAYERWIKRIPTVYRESVLGKQSDRAPAMAEDAHCLALLKHYRSLMPLAQEARKPMFHLRAADGAIGAHGKAAQQVGSDFRRLARRISSKVGIEAR